MEYFAVKHYTSEKHPFIIGNGFQIEIAESRNEAEEFINFVNSQIFTPHDTIFDELRSLRRQHYYCEDSWYSCPLAPGGCANESQEEDMCDCGADKYNKKLERIIKILQGTG